MPLINPDETVDAAPHLYDLCENYLQEVNKDYLRAKEQLTPTDDPNKFTDTMEVLHGAVKMVVLTAGHKLDKTLDLLQVRAVFSEILTEFIAEPNAGSTH